MLSGESIREFRTAWLPHLTDSGLDRLIELLDASSPLLVHGCFMQAIPMGCLATHAAWHHPATEHLTQEAGVCWLNRVAGLNPATSSVLREWDRCTPQDWEVRSHFLTLLLEERQARRESGDASRASRLLETVG